VDRLGPSVVRITVAGEIDLASAPLLDRTISEHRAADGEVVLDLSGVRFLDSTGLAVILRHSVTAAPRPGVKVRGTSETVERVFRMAGIEAFIERAE
jgi:anti-anti-sigma factor